MKSIKTLIIASVIVSALAVGIVSTKASAANTTDCKVEGTTPITDLHDTGKNFTFDGVKVTAHFKVTGGANCRQPVAFATWKAPSLSGHPLNEQKLHQSKVQTFGPGTHSMTLEIPKCGFWQIDLLNNTRATAADGSANYAWTDGMFDTMHGEQKCEAEKPVTPTTPQVQAAATPQTLVKSGPEATAAAFVGVSSLAGVGHAILRRIKRS